MSGWSWGWLGVLVYFLVEEGAALIVKDAPGHPRTLTANVRWLINGAGVWHHTARIILAVLLAWLPFHFGLPGTDWASVYPNIVASALCAATAIPGLVRWYKQHQAKLHAAHQQALADHHDRLIERIRTELGIGQ